MLTTKSQARVSKTTQLSNIQQAASHIKALITVSVYSAHKRFFKPWALLFSKFWVLPFTTAEASRERYKRSQRALVGPAGGEMQLKMKALAKDK